MRVGKYNRSTKTKPLETPAYSEYYENIESKFATLNQRVDTDRANEMQKLAG